MASVRAGQNVAYGKLPAVGTGKDGLKLHLPVKKRAEGLGQGQ